MKLGECDPYTDEILVDNNICSNQTIGILAFIFFAQTFDTACRRDDRIADS